MKSNFGIIKHADTCNKPLSQLATNLWCRNEDYDDYDADDDDNDNEDYFYDFLRYFSPEYTEDAEYPPHTSATLPGHVMMQSLDGPYRP